MSNNYLGGQINLIKPTKLHILIEKEIQKQMNELRYYDVMKHVFNEEIFTEDELIQRRCALSGLIQNHPNEAAAIPKARAIADQLESFGRISRHDYPVLDLRPINDLGGLKRWMEMVDSAGDIIMTPTYAGATLELVYVGGRLHKAVTKGCGIEGRDVTIQAYLVDGIPQEIENQCRVSIRGIVTIPTMECQEPIHRACVRALSTFRPTDGIVLRHQQYLRFIPDEVNIPENPFSTSDLRSILQTWGFYIGPAGTLNAGRREIGHLDEQVDDFYTRVNQSELPVTGIQFTVDSALRKMELGYTSRYAEWTIQLTKGNLDERPEDSLPGAV